MDRLGVNLKFIRMVEEQYAHTAQGIDVEVHQIVVVACNGVVPHNREADVLVDQREQFGHVLLQIFERVPDVHLRHVLAVRRRILELEPLAVPRWRIVDQPVTIAAAIWVGDAGPITARIFQSMLKLVAVESRVDGPAECG